MECRHFADDNFFMIKPYETKKIILTCDGLKTQEKAEIEVKFWNGEIVKVTV